MLARALWDRWQVDPETGDFVNYTTTAAAEFRYDSPRGRYLMVRYNTNNSTVEGDWTISGPVLWTDYPGGVVSPVPYLDVEADASLGSDPGGTWDPVRRYFALAGDQTLDPATGGVLQTAYWAGDLIDSTMAATDATGLPIDYTGGTGFQPVAYSAFGEVLDASGQPGGSAPAGFPRYQYAGGLGYEVDLLLLAGANPDLSPITLQHLGWRWYDPATGRFVQRDPIGLHGGTNVYVYGALSPLGAVDPLGLWSLIRWIYTGDGNASDEVYAAACEAAGRWLYENSPVRGGYIGAGRTFGGRTPNRGVGVAGGAGWTIDEGAFVWGCIGLQGSCRGRGSNGQFVSNTYGGGAGGTWGGQGIDVGAFGGVGSNARSRGCGCAGASDRTVWLGVGAGPLQGGIIVRLPNW